MTLDLNSLIYSLHNENFNLWVSIWYFNRDSLLRLELKLTHEKVFQQEAIFLLFILLLKMLKWFD